MVATPSSNALRARIEAGGVALGVLDNAYCPTLVEFYGELGLDFVWLDLEHGGPARSTRARWKTSSARRNEPASSRWFGSRRPTPSSSGRPSTSASGTSSSRALSRPRRCGKAVRSARFTYGDGPGDRGLASPRARRWGLADDYVAGEDRETLVGVTIETAESLADLDAILDVPELGFVFIGPFDLSVALGHPGEIDHPDVQEAVERIRSAAVDAGVPVGGLGFGMDDVNQKAEDGYQLINLGSTTGALKGVVDGWFDAVTFDREE
ncbi:HpcH/HpaI aldolase family protein [Haloferax sp. BAB-2207]|nr:HpcH/HpaI aldolase family protein [Haloferax sp. BAB-2207]